jgi:hypothetical protein
MARNTIFREYWAATRHHRDSLPDASEEAALGDMMNGLVEEMNHLVEDPDDGDEWWVTGQPPDE